jgi:hypothetical protein
MRLAQLALHLRPADFGLPRPNAADIDHKQRLETLSARRRQLVMADPSGIDPPIFVERGGEELRREVLPIVARCRSSDESDRISG